VLPDPLTVVTTAGHLEQLRNVRVTIADDPGAAWVVTRPLGGRDGYAQLTLDILTAIGCVGLGHPRQVGERHMVRVTAYLTTSPVTDLIVAEAQWLPEEVLNDLICACYIASTRLWLLTHPPVGVGLRAALGERAGAFTRWASFERFWRRRVDVTGSWVQTCPAAVDGWWSHPREAWARWEDATCAAHATRADCLLSGLRRALTAAATTEITGREVVTEVLDHPSTTATEAWAFFDAGRDLFTPARDAVSKLVPNMPLDEFTVAMIAGDGSRIGTVPVPPHMRAVLARQRAASILASGPGAEPLLTIFGEVPEVTTRRADPSRPRPRRRLLR